jgi:hypothetical protein
MIDPPRESATKAVQACQTEGIQVKMIIYDQAITVQAIARRMGMNKNGAVLALQVLSAILLAFTGLTHYLPKSPLNPHWGEQKFSPPLPWGTGGKCISPLSNEKKEFIQEEWVKKIRYF